MHSRVYRFDEFRIDPTRHEFWAGEEQVSLQLKVFEVLVYLLENRDRAVCRDELISAVWGRVDVSDNILNQVITHARQAVGDSAEKQRVIRTVRRFGYCWVQPVEEHEVELTLNGNGNGKAGVAHANGHTVEPDNPALTAGDGESSPEHTSGNRIHVAPASPAEPNEPGQSPESPDDPATPGTPPPAGRIPHRLALIVLAIAALGLTTTFWPDGSGEEQPGPSLQTETAMVLPVTVTGDDNAGWIRLGIMDLIGERLRDAGQPVLPSDNTMALLREMDPDGTGREPLAMAKSASASLVLEATAEAVKDYWQVTLRARHGAGDELATQASAPDVLAAARMAADHMARRLGHGAVDSPVRIAGGHAAEILLQRLRAEHLAENHHRVRELYASASEELQKNPRIRFQLAQAEMFDSRTAESATLFENLAREVDADSDPVFHAEIQYGLGFSMLRELDYLVAEEHLTRTLEVLGDRDDYVARRVRGSALGSRGAVRYFRGRPEDALIDLSRARIATESTGDYLRLISLDSNAGAIYHMMGRNTEAIAYLSRAAEQAQRFGRKNSEIHARQSLMNAHLALLDPESALSQVPRMRELQAETSSERLQVFSSLILSQVLSANGLYGALEDLLENLRNAKYQQEIPELGTLARTAVANHAMNIDEPARAVREARAALQPEWDPGSSLTKAQTWLVLIRALITLNQLDEAGESLATVKEWAAGNETPAVQLQIRLMEGELAAAAGDFTAARTAFEQALSLAESERTPDHVLDVVKVYVPFLIEQGDLERAGFLAGHTAGWSDRHYDAALVHLRLYHAMADTTAWRMALERARNLAGEREIPEDLLTLPSTTAGLIAANEVTGLP